MKYSTTITAIIETPKGSGFKYDFDPDLGYFKLKKVMPAGLVFPFDFGYIPGTIGEDGDPIDVMVISELQSFTGCAVDCRIIGGIMASQQERNGERIRNDRIIAIPLVSVQYGKVKKLSDLPEGITDQIENFFKNYNEQAGKVFVPQKRLTSLEASSAVKSAQDLAVKDNLVRLFIPVKNQDGNPFKKECFLHLNKELQEKFGGLTIYSQRLAEGIWKDGQETIVDDLLVYEVVTGVINHDYWENLKTRLKKTFAQQDIMIQVSKIHKI